MNLIIPFTHRVHTIELIIRCCNTIEPHAALLSKKKNPTKPKNKYIKKRNIFHLNALLLTWIFRADNCPTQRYGVGRLCYRVYATRWRTRRTPARLAIRASTAAFAFPRTADRSASAAPAITRAPTARKVSKSSRVIALFALYFYIIKDTRWSTYILRIYLVRLLLQTACGKMWQKNKLSPWSRRVARNDNGRWKRGTMRGEKRIYAFVRWK